MSSVIDIVNGKKLHSPCCSPVVVSCVVRIGKLYVLVTGGLRTTLFAVGGDEGRRTVTARSDFGNPMCKSDVPIIAPTKAEIAIPPIRTSTPVNLLFIPYSFLVFMEQPVHAAEPDCVGNRNRALYKAVPKKLDR